MFIWPLVDQQTREAERLFLRCFSLAPPSVPIPSPALSLLVHLDPSPCLWDSGLGINERKGTDENGNLNGQVVDLLYWLFTVAAWSWISFAALSFSTFAHLHQISRLSPTHWGFFHCCSSSLCQGALIHPWWRLWSCHQPAQSFKEI